MHAAEHDHVRTRNPALAPSEVADLPRQPQLDGGLALIVMEPKVGIDIEPAPVDMDLATVVACVLLILRHLGQVLGRRDVAFETYLVRDFRLALFWPHGAKAKALAPFRIICRSLIKVCHGSTSDSRARTLANR